MKRSSVKSLLIIIFTILMLFSGCSALLQELENPEIRQSTEVMLDALIADDFQSAYSLAKHICTEEDFKTAFAQMQQLLDGSNSYELKLLSIYTNSTLSNGQTIRSSSCVYELITNRNRLIINVKTDNHVGLNTFYLTPYENTDYYSTGSLENMKDANGVQWCFLLVNVVVIGLTVFALVDCCRHKIKKKVLWILLLLFGFISLGVTASPTGFRFNFNLGWITAYSALVRYGSGTIMLRLMLPVGTILYFILRRSLLKKGTPPVIIPETEPVCWAENTADQLLSKDPEGSGTQNSQQDS